MKRILQRFSLIFIIIILLQSTIFVTHSKAEDRLEDIFLDDIFSEGETFIEAGKSADIIEEKQLRSANAYIFNVLFYIGMALAVIIGGIIGIKFMVASAEDKAKIKETMIPYIIGCVVIFGAFGIWKLIIQVLDVL